MNQLKDRQGMIGTIIVLVLVCAVAGTVLIYQLTTSNAPLAEMHLTVGTEDGQDYCADFLANEDGDDKVKITITNCGETTFVLRIKGKKMGETLSASQESEIGIPRGAEFSTVIETTDGEYVGAFSY